jgi:7-cyano-7-deazaguanine synthase in queuosine biosynthesis
MKKGLLYSGGMDSFILRRLYNLEAVYFDLGSRYSDKEIRLIKKFNKEVAKDNPIKIHKLSFFGKNFEEESGYVPYRNLILFLKMTLLGSDEIYFGMVNEWQRDKNKSFFRLVENIVHDMGKRKLKIITPFYGMSKSNVLKKYIEAGFSVDDLYKYSRSCVMGTERECGQCISCLSKYIALVNNGVYRKGWFLKEPKVDDFIENRKARFGNDFRWGRVPSTIGKLLEAYEAKRKEGLRG